MEKSKLGLDFNKVAHAKELAKVISDQVQDFVDGYSTVACERTLCRLMGVDGIDESGVPLPNVLVDYLKEKGKKIFLDLKFHDIPNTMQSAVRAAVRDNVWLMTIHVSDMEGMRQCAIAAKEEAEKKGKHAKVSLNWAQAVVKVQFIEQVPVEELTMEEANEGEKE